MPELIHTSFAGGELSPSMYARVDVDKYDVGAALLRNFFVDFRGGAYTRAGTEFVAYAKSTGTVRLIPFIIGEEAAYVIEMGNLYFRFYVNGQQIAGPYEVVTPYLASELATVKFVQSADVLTLTHPNHPPANLTRLTPSTFAYTVIAPGTAVPTPGIPVITISAGGAGGQRYWYVITALSANGKEESLASSVQHIDVGGPIDGIGTHVTELTWAASAGASVYNIYRFGPGTATSPNPTVFGLLAQSTTITLTDSFGSPDYSKNPPETQNPLTGENPKVVSYFQQRRVYGSTPDAPEGLIFSQTANYDNFNTSLGISDTDGITFSLASREVNVIKSMVPMSTGLVVFTTGGASLVSGGGPGAPFTPTTINSDDQASTGANDMPPIKINSNILFVQFKGSTVRDLAFSFQAQSYLGSDRSALANHLFDGYLLQEWAYAQEPHKLVWVVRSDGRLLTLSYVPEQEVYGWSRHDTAGLFKSVASIPEGNENRVYFAVLRYLGGVWVQCIERLASRVYSNVEDVWAVDCGLAWPLSFPAATLTPSGVTGAITLSADAAVFAPGDIGKVVWLCGGNATVTGYTSGTVVSATVVKDLTSVLPDLAITVPVPANSGNWSMAAPTAVVHAPHLAGQVCSALIDGQALTGLTDDGAGNFTLPISGTKINLGLGFQAQLMTLKLETPQGTIQGKMKVISRVTVRVEKTRGLKGGQHDGPLYEIPDQEVPGVMPNPLYTGDLGQNTGGYWDDDGQLLFQQDYPLPAAILGLVPEFTVGDTAR